MPNQKQIGSSRGSLQIRSSHFRDEANWGDRFMVESYQGTPPPPAGVRTIVGGGDRTIIGGGDRTVI